MKKILLLLFVALSLISWDTPKKNYIPADNFAFDYVGRFDFSNDKAPKFNWPGVYIRFRFTGTSVAIELNGGNDNYFNVFVDGKLYVVSSQESTLISIVEGLKPGIHTFEIYKRTEGNVGNVSFFGAYIDSNAQILPWYDLPNRNVMFIGNSITCGYGVEGKHKLERFSVETENNYKSFGPILARAFRADYHIIAHSGLGVVRQYNDPKSVSTVPQMPKRFDLTLDNNFKSKWNHSNWIPDLVVINLGTNDYSTDPGPNPRVFKKSYKKLISRIKKVYGNVFVLCVIGPMIDKPCSNYVKQMVQEYRTEKKDNNIAFYNLTKELLSEESDWGSDWHPSANGQQKIAIALAPVIADVMNWNYFGLDPTITLIPNYKKKY